MKWCGKSAPRRRQRRRHGKPHREQDQVGAAGVAGTAGAAGRAFRAAARVGRARRPVTDVPDEWPSPRQWFAGGAGQNPAYRPSGYSIFCDRFLLCYHYCNFSGFPRVAVAKRGARTRERLQRCRALIREKNEMRTSIFSSRSEYPWIDYMVWSASILIEHLGNEFFY